ncbi:MAG: hypothetical protein ACRC7N_17550 [Clostridium sp.]
MGIYTYAKQLLKADFKQTFNYLISVSVLTLFLFNGLNVALNSKILNSDETIEINSIGQGVGSGSQTFIMNVDIIQKERVVWLIFVIILFSAFCNTYFLSRKSKEVGFALVNGSSLYEVIRFLIFQNGVLFLLSSILGIILGFATMPIFNLIIYKLCNINDSVFFVSESTITYTLLIIVVQCFYFIAFNVGHVYRKEIVDLLKEKSLIRVKDTRQFKIPPIIFFILYIIPFLYILFAEKIKGIEGGYNTASFISLLGILGIVSYGMPWLMNLLKKRKYMYDPLKVVYLSNFSYALSKSTIYFLALCLSFWYFSFDMMKYRDVKGIPEINMFILISIFIAVTVTLSYKMSCDGKDRSSNYVILQKLGYKTDEIVKVAKMEVVLYYLVGLGLPILFVVIPTLGYLSVGAMSIEIGSLLIGTLIIPIVISGIVSYFGYEKIARKALKGE